MLQAVMAPNAKLNREAGELPAYLRVCPGGVSLAVKVQPRASRNEIGEAAGGELKIKVTAPPVECAANEGLREFLAEILECPKSAVTLLRGETSRHKLVLVRGLSASAVAGKLARRT